MPPTAQPSSGRRPRGAAASLEKRHQRILDVAQLDAASEAVESLRAALSAAAASEEASRLEVAGLQAQIKAFRAEEEGRFQHQLRQQAELMRLRLRIGELSEQLGDRDSVTECAVIDVRCLQQELHHAEQRAKELTAELSSQRMHTQAQQKALHAAREREAADHRARLGEHSAQLEALREAMTSSQRVDPRKYLELLEPTYQRLAEGVKYERDMADALGHAWVAAEVEEAREAAVTAEVKLATSERAYLDSARLREEQHARRLEGVKASAASQVDELKEYIATLVTELQEKDASARQAQQSVLDQLHAERATFHASLRGMQEQLAAARSEVARKGRVQNRMLAKVMAAWDRRRLHRITLGWRAAVVRARMEAAGGLERRVHAAEVRLTASSMLIAEQRWRQVGLSRAFAQLRVFCDAVRAARTRGRSPRQRSHRSSAHRPPAAPNGGGQGGGGHHHHHHHHHHRHHQRRHHATTGRSAPHPMPSPRQRAAVQQPPTMPPVPFTSSEVPAKLATAAAGAPPTALTLGNDKQAARSPPVGQAVTKPVQQEDGTAERRAAYLDYLRACQRQGREPAQEVVEMARSLAPPDGTIEAASLLSLQIRSAEEQLGILPLPAAPTGAAVALVGAVVAS